VPPEGKSLINHSLSHAFRVSSPCVFFPCFFPPGAPVRGAGVAPCIPLGGKTENDTFRGLLRPEDSGEGNLPLIADRRGDGLAKGCETSNGTTLVVDPDGPMSASVAIGAVLSGKRLALLLVTGARSPVPSSFARRFPRATSLTPASSAKIRRRAFTVFEAMGTRPFSFLFSEGIKNRGVIIGTREDIGNDDVEFGEVSLKPDASSEERTLRIKREE